MTILDTIIEQKRSEVRALKNDHPRFEGRSSSPRPFAKALDRLPEVAIIAEAKKASPSKGIICPNFDPVAIARAYEAGGAAAISVLTDEKFFQGSIDYLVKIREAVGLPVLRKDFIIDPLQVEETAHLNADAMLLIDAALSDGQMAELYSAARELGIEPLIEIHSGSELDRAMKLEPSLIGINNRDLATFVVDLKVTTELIRHIPREVTVVSESGIENGEQTELLRTAGVKAVLVGESLVKLQDPSKLMKELAHARED